MKKIKPALRWAENKIIIGLVALIIFLALSVLINQYLTQAVFQKNSLQAPTAEETEDLSPSSSLSGPQYSNQALKEAEVFSIPETQTDFAGASFTPSPDGQHFAYLLKKDGQESVVLNGAAGASYDAITFMRFSPDGNRFAYGAKLNGKELVVLDGQEGKLYDWIFEPRFFTTDSRYFFYKARTDQGEIMVFNNNESRAYDKIYGTLLNADKTQLIYYGRIGEKIWQAAVTLNKVKE